MFIIFIYNKKLDAAIKETRYIILSNYNFKNPILIIGIDDIPDDAIKLYKREKLILSYKRDIEEIVKWLVTLIIMFLILNLVLSKFENICK